MKSRIHLSLLLVCGVGLLRAHPPASPSNIPLPPGPLIQQRAPEFSRWTIFSKPTAKDNDEQNKPSGTTPKSSSPNGDPKFSITKTGNITRVVYFDDAKQPWNIWCFDRSVIAVWPDGKNVGIAAKPTGPDAYNPLYMDFSKSDFQGFEWISEKNFAGISEVLGRKCLVFRDTVKRTPPGMQSDDPDPASASFEHGAVASIDLETRLPVTLVNENGLFIYQFYDPPAALQTLPANVQAVIDQQRQAAQAVARRPSRPF
jgi:hypothetical protein